VLEERAAASSIVIDRARAAFMASLESNDAAARWDLMRGAARMSR
jgi:hypothetical protein